MKDKLNEINKYGIKAIGKKEICAHLNGKKITRNAAIIAKCYECNCYYADGKADCEIPTCPLYGFMPYRKNNRDGD